MFIWLDLELMAIMAVLIGVMLYPGLYVPLRQIVNVIVDMACGSLPPFLNTRANPEPEP